jgi:hypothetical protein
LRPQLSEDLFYAQDELVALDQVFSSYLAVGINEEEPFAMIHDGAGTDPADLLAVPLSPHPEWGFSSGTFPGTSGS